MNTPTKDAVSESDDSTTQVTLVQINIVDSYGNVDQPDARLSKINHDTVCWRNTTGDTAYIVFNTKKHSPLDDEIFIIPAGQTSDPRKIKDSVQGDETKYKYAVLAADGVNDPTVIINR
jgi:hypothetical protein